MVEQSEETTVIRGSSARTAAAVMNYGNIIAIIFIPLILFWIGASMLVYAMNRHHPNPKVGYYTQQAAYRLYGVTGFFMAVAIFIPGSGWIYYLIAWVMAAVLIIPLSLLDLLRIYQDEWVDILLEEEE